VGMHRLGAAGIEELSEVGKGREGEARDQAMNVPLFHCSIVTDHDPRTCVR
jgi:hypothetical protein